MSIAAVPTQGAPRAAAPIRPRHRRFPWLAALIVALFTLITLAPIYWMVISSLKPSAELMRIPPTFWPETFTLQQYRLLAERAGIWRATGNSLVLALGTTAIVIVLGSAAAFAVTHLRYRRGRVLLGLSLITQFLPHAAVLLPVFVVWSALGLVNSLPGITLVYVAVQLPIAVWLLTGHFRAIPHEVIEAAQIDGASPVRTLLLVAVPMALPGIGAVAIWCIIAVWSELLFGLVLLSSHQRTVSVALASLIGENVTEMGIVMAGATIATLPPVIMFFLLQRFLTNGLAGAVKG